MTYDSMFKHKHVSKESKSITQTDDHRHNTYKQVLQLTQTYFFGLHVLSILPDAMDSSQFDTQLELLGTNLTPPPVMSLSPRLAIARMTTETNVENRTLTK